MLIPENGDQSVETEAIRCLNFTASCQRDDRTRLVERGPNRNSGRKKTAEDIDEEVENINSENTTEWTQSVTDRPSKTRRARRLNVDRNAPIEVIADAQVGSDMDQNIPESILSDDEERVLAMTTPNRCPHYSDEQSLFASPDFLRIKPFEKFCESKRVADFANQPNLKFAFENAMLPNTISSQNEKKVLTEREKLPSFSIENMERPLGIVTPHSQFRTDILTMKNSILKSKKPSAIAHKSPLESMSSRGETRIDRTDYSETDIDNNTNATENKPRLDKIRKKLKQIKTRGLTIRRPSSSSSSSSASSPSSASNVSGAPPLFFSPLTHARKSGGSGLKDDEDFLPLKNEGGGLSPPKVGFNQLYGASETPITDKDYSTSPPSYVPRPAREKKSL